METTNLFWFGFVIEFILILLIIKLVDLGSNKTDKFDAERKRLRRDYQRVQQELKQKAELTQESLRLQQELQQQKEQLAADYLRLQQELQQQESLTREHSSLQQELQQQKEQLTQDYLQLQQELQQQKEQLTQQCLHLQQELQTQEARLATNLRHAMFQQLQTLLTNYPSASKIAQLKPELPAKNLTLMLTPLDNLIQSWGYEVIGNVWEQTTYDPQLHQSDVPDIQPGEPVYIRYVGYRDGDTILCPAKVSRSLPGATKDPTPQPPVADTSESSVPESSVAE